MCLDNNKEYKFHVFIFSCMGMLMTWGCNLLQEVGVDDPSQYQYISKLTEARVCSL